MKEKKQQLKLIIHFLCYDLLKENMIDRTKKCGIMKHTDVGRGKFCKIYIEGLMKFPGKHY